MRLQFLDVWFIEREIEPDEFAPVRMAFEFSYPSFRDIGVPRAAKDRSVTFGWEESAPAPQRQNRSKIESGRRDGWSALRKR